ncbi:MAG TPA: amidohydrolase family protein [Bryobacteraceae bacterium]|nr:amidohydrolase family protein [Bryobacteraceae bacterium]
MPRLLLALFLLAAAAHAEPADWIWTARYVVTMDPARRVIENGAVAIRADRILAVGPRAEIDRRYQAAHRLDRPDALIAPGLVNTHTHVPMSLLRGIANDVRLQDWLTKFIFPAEARNVTADFVRWGTRLACLEMLLSGTTTYTDMYYFEDAIAEADREAGLRAVLGETIIGFPVPDAPTPEDALRFTERYIQRYRNDPLVVPAVAPHALYTNSDATLKAARALADRYGVPLVIHIAETCRERDDALAKWGKTPVAELDSLGVLTGRTIAAHCVWVDDADIAILKSRATGVAHCPSSNMMLSSGVAPVVKMLAAGLNVGLGTDGPAGSNNDFDLMEEMDLAAKLQKVSTADPQALSAAQALEMATIGGARALGLEKEIGSLEPGKRADLITMRLDVPNAVPLYDVVSQIVYALKGAGVRDSMVNGRLLLGDHRPLTLDQDVILAKAAEYGLKVSESLKK